MPHQTHPWTDALHAELDALEAALLQADPVAVQAASQRVQAVLGQAPKTAAFGQPGSSLRLDMHMAAHRFGQLRQAVIRANAQSQRAVGSLLPQHAQPTYQRALGGSGLRGAGQAYLSA